MKDYDYISMIEDLPDYIQEILDEGKEMMNFPERSGIFEGALLVIQAKLNSVIRISQEVQQLHSKHEADPDPFGVLSLLDEATKIR